MTAKHRDPDYRKNARIIRQQVTRKRALGVEVACWRCGRLIDPEQTFDVGHINQAGDHSIGNLAPEHRYKSGRCQGNRAHGGRIGRAMQSKQTAQTKGLLQW
jgi:hypothetical protein